MVPPHPYTEQFDDDQPPAPAREPGRPAPAPFPPSHAFVSQSSAERVQQPRSGGGMVRRFAFGILLLIFALLAFAWWRSAAANRRLEGGNLTSSDGPLPDSNGAARPRAEAARAAAGGAAPANGSQGSAAAAGAAPGVQLPQGATGAEGAGPQTGQAQPSGTDSLPANPPDGAVFSGTGKYQFYRQGDLTWRLNTETGHACVLLATEEQWQRPVVLAHGCASER